MATANQNLSSIDTASLPDASEMRFALVRSEWNHEITNALAKGAHATLLACGTQDENILHFDVPGSYELPLGAQMLLENDAKLDAVICLGSVIQGETKHFDFVCEAVAQGIKDVALKFNKPVVFGVLTDNTLEQAKARSGGKHGNKGDEAAATAVKMVALQKSLKPSSSSISGFS